MDRRLSQAAPRQPGGEEVCAASRLRGGAAMPPPQVAAGRPRRAVPAVAEQDELAGVGLVLQQDDAGRAEQHRVEVAAPAGEAQVAVEGVVVAEALRQGALQGVLAAQPGPEMRGARGPAPGGHPGDQRRHEEQAKAQFRRGGQAAERRRREAVGRQRQGAEAGREGQERADSRPERLGAKEAHPFAPGALAMAPPPARGRVVYGQPSR